MTLVPVGRIDPPAIAAFVLASLMIAVSIAVPARVEQDAVESIAVTLDRAPIERSGLRAETVVDMSALGDELFVPHDVDPFHVRQGEEIDPFEPPSMFADDASVHGSLDLPRFLVAELNGERPAFPMKITARVHQAFDELATVVERAEPTRSRRDEGDPPVVDVYLTQATIDSLQIDLGDELQLINDSEAPITRAYQALAELVTMRVEGIVELAPEDHPAWFGDERLHRATRNDTHDGFEVVAFAAVSSDAFQTSPWIERGGGLALLSQTQPLSSAPQTLAEAQSWRSELQRMESSGVALPTVGQTVGRSELGSQLDDLAAARAESERTTQVILFSLGALITLMVLRLIQHAIANRRRPLAVLRSRGVSVRQLATTAAAVGASAGLAAGLVGLAFGVALSPSTPAISTMVVRLGVAAIGGALFMAGAVTALARSDLAGELSNLDRPPSLRERAFDLTIILIAIAAIVTVSQRSSRPDGFDEVGAVSLTVAALACGIIGRRILRWLAGRLRPPQVSSDLALRRIGSGRSPAPLIIEVVALATALVGMSATVAKANADDRVDQSWEASAAPIRVEAELGEQLDLAALAAVPGVSTVAGETTIVGPLMVGEAVPAIVTLLALDTDEAQLLTADDPTRPLPAVDLFRPQSDGRIPVLVPEGGVGNGPIANDTTVRGIGALEEARMVVVGTHRLRQADGPAIVVDRRLLGSALDRAVEPRAASLDGSPEREEIETLPAVARMIDRVQVLSDLDDDPLNRSVTFTLRLVLFVAASSVLVLVVFAAILVAARRRPQSALLSALGARRADVERAVVVEVLAALIAGVLAGVLSTVVIFTWLDSVVTSRAPASDAASPQIIDVTLIAVLSAMLLLGFVSAFITTRLVSERRPAHTLRSELT